MPKTLQEEYSSTIKRDGAVKFVGSYSISDFHSHSKIHFNYLKEQGLQPHHKFLDVGCGALRTGSTVIPYLQKGNYYGLDRMPELIEYGLNEVLQKEMVFDKSPNISVNEHFDFSFVNCKVDYVWCQSLMSHLNEYDIKTCLNNIKNVCHSDTQIYFTYFQMAGLERSKTEESHSKVDIMYDANVMDDIVKEVGLNKVFNGEIHHPRQQWMYICKV